MQALPRAGGGYSITLKGAVMNVQALNRTGNAEVVSGLLPNKGLSIDTIILVAIVLAANTHLITGNFSASLVFFPSAVAAGQLWRLITYPFVHVTWYHLILDAGAFFLLYKELSHNRPAKRIFYVVGSGLFSLGAAMVFSPIIDELGLCGLSGIAHGLMAVSALEMMQQKKDFRTGLACLLLVIFKSSYELIAGEVLFSFLHFGLYGTPLAACHAGGVFGGIVAYFLGTSSMKDSIARVIKKH